VRRTGLRETSRAAASLADLTCRQFLTATRIKTPQGEGTAAVPFDLWPAQQTVLAAMERDARLIILKARQLGISWLACGYALWLCTTHPGKTVLLFSQGQREANELIDRISFMHYQHRERSRLPRFVTENTQELAWANGSAVQSLPATRKAGRSFSASLVVFDEFAFMLFGADLYAAAKPTIDDGGKLWIVSSADALGSPYHQFWQAAVGGANGFTPIFLDWRARPSRDEGWRARKLIESYGDAGAVKREYPESDIEAFTHAAGLVYDVWSDGPPDGNVTDAADYEAGAGPVYWAVDDGYSGERDATTGQFSADSHPRVFLLIQEMSDGRLCVFYEDYRIKALSDQHIADVAALTFTSADGEAICYPAPEYAAVDSAAAELRGRLHALGYYTRGKPQLVEESIKTLQRMLAADQNGYRRILVHPRCVQLRSELASYRRDVQTGKPVSAFDHGPSALRYFAWTKRLAQ
jgi:hypothetical protein